MITGYASLWGVADLAGDVVVRGAFAPSVARRGSAGVRMLYQHGERTPVGVWTRIEEDDRGLRVEGRILDITPEGRMAAALVRAGALDGLSIGFRAIRARRDGRLRVLAEVDLWEVSLVTFPMLPGARLQYVLRRFHPLLRFRSGLSGGAGAGTGLIQPRERAA
ncbi:MULTISPECIES: HK97 family phage prohead protease [unclassified Brevundimonas]|uniref:HK97 family phage prohead protease n=1 Tax=unclassified Brevundimonas TaxID=2622653 RepID=UPI00257D6466|nr:HK97 family phage prohead protease [Brevundimonas sp. UBA2503]